MRETRHSTRWARYMVAGLLALLAARLPAEDCPGCGNAPAAASPASDLWRARTTSRAAQPTVANPHKGRSSLRWLSGSTPRQASHFEIQRRDGIQGTDGSNSPNYRSANSPGQPARLPSPPAPAVRNASQIFGYVPPVRPVPRPTVAAPRPTSAAMPSAATASDAPQQAPATVSRNSSRQPLSW